MVQVQLVEGKEAAMLFYGLMLLKQEADLILQMPPYDNPLRPYERDTAAFYKYVQLHANKMLAAISNDYPAPELSILHHFKAEKQNS